MSPETVRWLLVGHIFGFMMWTGILFGLFRIMEAHAGAEKGANDAFSKLEKSAAIAMDIGATLAIGFGLLLIFLPPGGTLIFKAGGFFHIKLTLVAVLLGIHVILRRKIKSFAAGEGKPLPAWLFPIMQLLVLGIIILIIVRPFAK